MIKGKAQHKDSWNINFLHHVLGLHQMCANLTSQTLNFLSDKSVGFWRVISVHKKWGHPRVSFCYCSGITFFLLL